VETGLPTEVISAINAAPSVAAVYLLLKIMRHIDRLQERVQSLETKVAILDTLLDRLAKHEG
jgi:hypothetical protein